METSGLDEFIYFLRIVRDANVAVYALTVYDWLLCLGDEVDFIMNTASPISKTAYLFCRYIPLVVFPLNIWGQVIDHDLDMCRRIFRVPMLLVILYNVSASAILILRIYAFTAGNWMVTLGLICCVLANASYLVYVVVVHAVLQFLSRACIPGEVGSTIHLSGIFLGNFLLDCVITFVFATCVFRVYKLRFFHMSQVTRTFVREGLAYFIAISIVNLLNVAFNLQPNPAMASVNVAWSLLCPNILACRLVLNLRKAAMPKSPEENTTVDVHTLPRRINMLRGLRADGRDVELYPMGHTFDATLSEF